MIRPAGAAPLPPLTFYHTEGDLSSTFLLKKCYIFINNLLQNVTKVLRNCYEIITKLLQNCYETITKILQAVTELLQAVTAGPPIVNKFVTKT